MRKNLISVLNYFAQFSYAPSFDELHMFYPVLISPKRLQQLIQKEMQMKKIIRFPNNMINRMMQGSKVIMQSDKNATRYTLPQYSILVKKYEKKLRLNFLNKPSMTVQIYLSLLKALPFIRFLGVTGASAMNGYAKDDDLDLFIIAAHNRMWTARFFAVTLAKLLGIHGYTGVCLNLFFDEAGMSIPEKKQNMYIAHELLQVKPLVDKQGAYSLLIGVNRWISRFFPNAPSGKKRINIPTKRTQIGVLERLFRQIQMPIIAKNKTGFRITSNQLWLFKRDFERTLPKRYRQKMK